jgi:ribosomal protein L9
MDISISNNISFAGEAKNTVKINKDGVDFISFKNDALVSAIREAGQDIVHVQLIGRPEINEFRGSYQVQIKLNNDDIKITTPVKVAAAEPVKPASPAKSLLDLI